MIKTWWEDLKRIPYFDTQWAIVWASIFVCFIFLDIIYPGWSGTALIKYLGIFLCVVYAYTKYRNDLMLVFALLLTFIADTALVWTNWVVAGVYVFCFAQFMHLLRFSKAHLAHIFTCAAGVSTIFAILVIHGCQPIYVIVSIYAMLLITNLYLVIVHFKHHRNDFKARCAMYGFIAFLCCDICVAMQFLALNSYISPAALPTINFLIWLFYYPSQVLIANSSTTAPSSKESKSLRKKSQ